MAFIVDIDEDALWRAVASICGALTVLADTLDPKHPKAKDNLTQGIAYADSWLDNIDPFAAEDDGVKFTLERGK